MSVILDALRRRESSAGRRPLSHAAGIPVGLRPGLPRARATVAKETGTRWGLLAGVIGTAVIIFAGVQFGLPLLQQRMSAPRVVATTGATTGPVSIAPAREALAPAPRDAAPAEQPAPAVDEQPVAAAATAAPDTSASSMTTMLDKVHAPPTSAPRALPSARAAAGRAPAAAQLAGQRRPPVETAPRETASAPLSAQASVPARPAARAAAPPLAAAAPLAPPPAQVTPPAASDVNHFEMAVRYQSLGNFEQALAHYTAVLQANEFNAEARNNLGLLYLDRGLTGDAVDQFRRAILINPEYLKARSNLGVVLLNAGRLDEARAELRAALEKWPRNAELLVNMALVEKSANQSEVAKQILLRALSAQPNHAAAHYNLGVLLDEEGDAAQAYDHYNDFLKNAGPEYGARLSDVRRRIDSIAPRINTLR